MKKLTTKLLMSIIAVAFAFVALGTSTYAWFSMNTSVSATGLEITAKADQTFLLISATNTNATAIQSENSKEADFNMAAAAELYPVTFDSAATVSLTNLNDTTKWKVANSNNPDDAQVDATQTALPSDADLTKYVLMDEVYVTVAAGAVPAEDLVVKSITIPANKGIKVAIATEDAAVIFSASSTTADTNILAASISDSTVITVKVFVYFEGTDANVKQTNLANLNGEISFELKVND